MRGKCVGALDKNAGKASVRCEDNPEMIWGTVGKDVRMRTFDREKDFEDAMVTERWGWKDGVLDHPTEADLLRNCGEILFRTNREIDRLGDWPPTKTEMDQLLDQVKAQRTPLKLNAFINGRTAAIRRDHPGDVAHLGKDVSVDIFDRAAIAGGRLRTRSRSTCRRGRWRGFSR